MLMAAKSPPVGERDPKLSVKIRRQVRAGGGEVFFWGVYLVATSSMGQKALLYRGIGKTEVDIEGKFLLSTFTLGPQVHVEGEHWSTLEDRDRMDVRKMMFRLAHNGIKKMRETGQEHFEHIIP